MPRETNRAALEAICRTILPAAFSDESAAGSSLPPAGLDLVALVRTRIESLPARQSSGLRTVVRIVGSRAFVFATTGRALPFAGLDADTRATLLRRMERSSVPALRTMYQALRRVVLSAWYSEPTVQEDLGYRTGLTAGEGVGEGEGEGRTAGGGEGGRTAGAAVHLAARRLEPGKRCAAEVVVIGSGAGGAVAAAILAESGRDVLLLEEGRAWPVAERTGVERDIVPRVYAEGCARATDDQSVQILQGRALGGGTFVNWMLMLRTPDDVVHDWRTTHGFDIDERTMGVALDEVARELSSTVVDASEHSRNNRILLEGAARLHVDARAAAINAKGCVRAGLCGLGCPWSAKQSVDETWLPRALRAGARIATGVRVRAIERGTGETERFGVGKRLAVEVLDAHGGVSGQATIDTPLVVIAAGAIETPALLQRSGLGGGGVGKWLRLHPTSAIAALHDEPVHSGQGIPMSVVCTPEAAPDGFGYWVECPPFLPGLGSVALPGFGERHRRLMSLYPRIATNIVLVRDGADADVSQGSVRVDGEGRARIRYRVGERERTTLTRGLTMAARLQLAAGAREVVTLHAEGEPIRSEADLPRIAAWPCGPNQLTVFSAHVMGTCRIGTDPATSGCRPDGQRHEARGVYVLDGSLLPTAPGVNPQQTIMALALVLARRLAAG